MLIEAQNISLKRQHKQVLQDVSLQVSEKEIVTLIGPNGCGKSSLLRILLGLVKPNRGSVNKSSGLRIGYMPQKLRIDDRLPLNVNSFLMLAPGARKERVADWLQRLGIEDLKQQPVQALSGGEWQRVLLARALLCEPHLLVLDEPVQGVDVQGQRELYQLLPQLRDELGCAILLVSHDLHLVMAATDKVICLNGHVCCSGHPDQVSISPEYEALFGVKPVAAQVEQDAVLAHYTHHHDHVHCRDGHVEAVKPESEQQAAKGSQL